MDKYVVRRTLIRYGFSLCESERSSASVRSRISKTICPIKINAKYKINGVEGILCRRFRLVKSRKNNQAAPFNRQRPLIECFEWG